MEKEQYIERADKFVEHVLSLDNEFCFIVRDYYKDSPKEKGKKDTDFYKEMNGLLELLEVRLRSMKDSLEDPDLIQGHDTK